jgi:hypothetical protein
LFQVRQVDDRVVPAKGGGVPQHQIRQVVGTRQVGLAQERTQG